MFLFLDVLKVVFTGFALKTATVEKEVLGRNVTGDALAT